MAHSKAIATLPPNLAAVLLGGDATNDNVVDINDAACIGAQYGIRPQLWNRGTLRRQRRRNDRHPRLGALRRQLRPERPVALATP